MSGKSRLPGGEPRKASQKHSRRSTAGPAVIAPSWHHGDRVHWRTYIGTYLRDAEDEQAEISVGTRTYRVSKTELRPAGP
jgi:hypothetical protein